VQGQQQQSAAPLRLLPRTRTEASHGSPRQSMQTHPQQWRQPIQQYRQQQRQQQ
jgi:hypothetical protein